MSITLRNLVLKWNHWLSWTASRRLINERVTLSLYRLSKTNSYLSFWDWSKVENLASWNSLFCDLHVCRSFLSSKRQLFPWNNQVYHIHIRTNSIKAKIDDRRLTSVDDRDKTVIHIMFECCKLAQKEYKSRNDRVFKGDP